MKKPALMGLFGLFIILGVMMFTVSTSFADTSSEDLSSGQLRKMESQIQSLQDIIAKQNGEIQSIKSSMGSPSGERVAAAPQAAPTIDKDDFLALSKEAYPWMYGLKQGGDFRMRYEAFDTSHCDPSRVGLACNRSRNRFRIRLRYGFEKKLNDEFTVGFRLATGSLNDPTSTNQTLTGYFTEKAIFIDQAYAIYTPNLFKNLGPIDGLELGVGKFKNPFEKYSSKLVFDRDVNPEGIYEKSTVSLWTDDKNTVKWDIAGGQFILNENSGARTDAELFGVQTGLDISTFMFGTARAVESRTGFSFYAYPGWQNTIAANTAGADFHNGNTSDMLHAEVLDLYQEFKFYPFSTPTTIWGEVTNNIGNKSATLTPRDEYGFALGTTIGDSKKKGGWDVFLNYFYIGANEAAGVFTDSDFGNGFTNGKGWNFGLDYGLTEFLTLSWSNYVVQPVQPINDPSSSSDRAAQDIYRSQLDLVWKF